MVRNKPECKCAIDRYGYTDNHDDAGFIMPDGKMLDLSSDKTREKLNYDEYVAVPHFDVGNCLSKKKERDSDYAVSTWLEKCNAIRVNTPAGALMFEAVSKPTTEQVDAMLGHFTEDSDWCGFIGYRNKCPKSRYIVPWNDEGRLDPWKESKDDCLCEYRSSDVGYIPSWNDTMFKMDVQRWISKCW